MDLAKIRKKSLQSRAEPADIEIPATPAAAVLMRNALDSDSAGPVPSVADYFHKESYSAPATFMAAEQPPATIVLREQSAPARTPLEAILAGRIAAGCTNEASVDDDASGPATAKSVLEFLCFRVSDENYGINIMDIKEIITPREVTEVPRAPLFVSGVLSLRGTIIPIIDMHLRLGLAREGATGKERIIVIKNNDSFSGLLVDEVVKVVQVPIDAVEAAPAVLDGIDRDFVSGLGHSEGRLIILLNLGTIADINLY